MADKKISALTSATTPLAGTEVLPIVQGSATVKVAVASITNSGNYAGKFTTLASIWPTASNGVVRLEPNSNLYEMKLLISSANAGDGGMAYGDSGGNNLDIFGYSNIIFRNLSISGSLGTETWRIDTNNNLIPKTAAKGVNFTANTPAAGMTSQLLNDYEEGTWTPTVTPASGSITSYTSSGTYTKIGRQVTINATVTVTNNGTGAGNYVVLGGMPFSATSLYFVGVGAIGNTGEMVSASLATSTTIIVTKYNYAYPTATGYNLQINLTYFV